VFTAALASKVEHLHHLWGKGDADEVTDLGQAYVDQDKVLWLERQATYSR
jgi:hypothetical protein